MKKSLAVVAFLVSATILPTYAVADQPVMRVQLDSPIILGSSGAVQPEAGISAPGRTARIFQNVAVAISLTNRPAGTTIKATGLPAGLNVVNDEIVGNAPTEGTYGVTLELLRADSTVAATGTVTIVVVGLLTATVPQAGFAVDVNQPLTITPNAANRLGAVSWAHNLGTLPTGLSFNSATGVITGTPTTVALNPSARMTAVDQTDSAIDDTDTFSFNVRPVISLATAPLVDGKVENAYSNYDFKPRATVTGATAGNLGWTVAPDVGTGIPAGMTLSSAGVLGGAPTAAGDFSFSVVASYMGGNGQQAYTLKIGSDFLYGVTKVAVGSASCAMTSGGSIYCWGYNDDGRIGDGTTVSKNKPIQVKGPAGVGVFTGAVDLIAGSFDTCAIKSGGTLWCWGFNNASGQTGTGATTNVLYPAQVKGVGGVGFLTNVEKIAGASNLTCALSGGSVFCWGANSNGGVGNGTFVGNIAYPSQVVGVGGTGVLTGMTSIAVGGSGYACASSSTTAYCWGASNNGQLGAGSTMSSNSPVAVRNSGNTGNLTNISNLTGGYGTVCATSSGTLYCWGDNTYGQVGDNTAVAVKSLPAAVVNPSGSGTFSPSKVSIGNYHTCAVSSGSAYCWGYNAQGQIGDSFKANVRYPTAVKGIAGTGMLPNVSDIAAGAQVTCAVSGSGTYCWGSNVNGELGLGSNVDRTVPGQVTKP